MHFIFEKVNQSGARLVAVSKTHSGERIMQVYAQGQRIFGENRVQELTQKYELLPKDIHWHFIGSLQTNKVKYIAPFVAMIHSIDSLRLLEEVNKQAAKHDRQIPCLLQFHIAEEESKHGFSEEDAIALLKTHPPAQWTHVRIVGVMGMATFTQDMNKVRTEFRHLRQIFLTLKSSFFAEDAGFREISMGMSGDWEIALEEGSTLVRIGSLIFGDR